MPQIKEYTQRTEAAGPVQGRRATSEDFGGGAGRALSQLGGAVTQLGDALHERQEQSELSTVSVELSKAQADATVRLKDETQKGTLDVEKFNADYDEQIGKISEGVSTRGAKQYFDRSSQSLKSEIFKSTFAAQSELAGAKAKMDYKQTLSNYSSSLMNDPSSFDTASAAQEEYLNTLVQTGKMQSIHAEELKVAGRAELGKAAVRGWIDLSPEQAKADLKSGKWDQVFDADQKRQLESESDSAISAREIDAERAEKLKEKQKKTAQEATQNKFLEDMVNGKLSAKDILKSNLDPTGGGSKDQFLKMLKEGSNEGIKTDTGVYTELFNRVHLPDGDPNKIVDENDLNKYLGKGLKLSDIKDLRSEMQGKGTIEGQQRSMMKKQLMAVAKSKLTKTNPMMGMKDPEGDQQYLAYMQTIMVNQYNQQIKKGKTDLELFSPDSPDYLGRFIGNYSKSPSQIMQDQIKTMRPAIPQALPDGTIPGQFGKVIQARKPGESVADYLKRTKAGP